MQSTVHSLVFVRRIGIFYASDTTTLYFEVVGVVVVFVCIHMCKDYHKLLPQYNNWKNDGKMLLTAACTILFTISFERTQTETKLLAGFSLDWLKSVDI